MDKQVQKVLDKLQVIVNDFVAQFDLTAQLGTDFGYYWYDEVVEYAVIVNKRFDTLFTKFLTERYPDVTAPLFIWSLLHEIGHAETFDFFDEGAYAVFYEFKRSLDANNDADVMEYYNCPDELCATNWAYLYIRDNAPKIKALWNEILPLLKELETYVED